MGKEKNAYILGTELAELNRLGFQHQVWSDEARKGWKKAGFSFGDHILDLGSGPGFCSLELAYLVGEQGKVIATDKSEIFISFLNDIAMKRGLDMECISAEYQDLELETSSLAGIYHRWALAWIDNVDAVVSMLAGYLKPKGKIVSHEYYDWSTFQINPMTPAFKKSIQSALNGWEDMAGDINIGRRLPNIYEAHGLKVESTRLLGKMAMPGDQVWHWPKTFFQVYLPKLVERGYLDEDVRIQTMKDFDRLEGSASTTLFCPSMIEVIASKP